MTRGLVFVVIVVLSEAATFTTFVEAFTTFVEAFFTTSSTVVTIE